MNEEGPRQWIQRRLWSSDHYEFVETTVLQVHLIHVVLVPLFEDFRIVCSARTSEYRHRDSVEM